MPESMTLSLLSQEREKSSARHRGSKKRPDTKAIAQEIYNGREIFGDLNNHVTVFGPFQ